MGRVLVEITVENLQDLFDAKRGLIQPDQVRRVKIPDALVDTGASTLSLPTRLIRQLGVTERYRKRALDSRGHVGDLVVYEPVRLTIMDRDCSLDIAEVPDNVPVLVGQIPLEAMDLVVDPKAGRVTGNPAHDGEHIIEMF
jgi:predicted aspartyl protease